MHGILYLYHGVWVDQRLPSVLQIINFVNQLNNWLWDSYVIISLVSVKPSKKHKAPLIPAKYSSIICVSHIGIKFC